ncbi:MAG: SDR family oxidoreductase [Gammaproteobacteria bacterium]|nr:SDR family oxidoreductase [Gammaproteobacteria bacterium]
MTDRLAGKVAYITGAGSGIARAASVLFAQNGAKVVIAEIDEAKGRETLAQVVDAGGEGLFVHTDVTSADSVRESVDAAAKGFGKLDVLFNCAGGSIAADAEVTEVDLDVWEYTIDLDLKGPFLCCRYGIPHLVAAGGGSIVNVSSIVALRGNFPGHIYTAAKGGIISFTQALAGRYWRDRIRANAIAPGVILSDRILGRSDIDANLSPDEKLTKAQEKMSDLFGERHPFGYGTPLDIANVALFLASDEARMVNAAVIPAEGGLSAY